ncbi:hypothetical protein SDJN03_14975, partial [Cucurbita argyrosperma subsp. sororia]
MEACVDSRKRLRDESNDSLFNFIGSNSKFVRLDSANLDVDDAPIASVSSDAKSIDSSGLDSFQANLIQDDLLKILDDVDAYIDRELEIQDLDSVIRSFEKEIQVPVPSVQPELGFLLEASDDELGLPPAGEKEETEAVNFAAEFLGSGGMKGILGLEDETVPNYCWLENLRSENEWNREEEEEVVVLGGLFDHTDVATELAYRSETMPCL